MEDDPKQKLDIKVNWILYKMYVLVKFIEIGVLFERYFKETTDLQHLLMNQKLKLESQDLTQL